MIVDNQQRSEATDPSQSYIVQAPAGSGKTEILTQRFLRLLGGVHEPEQIIALTFTRKAAHEMRDRIILTLQRVAGGAKATSPHQQTTYDYASLALQRDKQLHWNLLKQPNRLRIMTIDALCQVIARAIPLQENQLSYADITDKPKALYKSAARNCLQYIHTDPNYHASLKTILYHLDNRQDRLLDLFIELLANRDQWLHPLYQARIQDKGIFEQAIAWLEQHELTRFRASLPLELAYQLMALTRQLAKITARDSLSNWESMDQVDAGLVSELAAILLTSQHNLRKAFDHHIGLKRGVCHDEDYNSLKQQSSILLAQLNELPDFVDALIRVRQLPKPQYDPAQWNVLQALFQLLPLLVAHLNLVFRDQNAVDFCAVSQQALVALGEESNPTDLALYLDNHIQHLLVDEFQDTSIHQFQLLQQLVQGWEPNDGRTLFIVGDPMQSIYRFRSAEVGLFLRTRTYGIGPVKLIPLELTCNFRSTASIVNWVNLHFKRIFPARDDIESGAVSFHTSSYVQPATEDSYVKAFQSEQKESEAHALVDAVEYELHHYPNDDIAILVRSRHQLSDIIQVLHQRHIPFQGVDIDLLANLPHLRDIWSLTQVLLMPANRLAWLSFLRSPWCGLSLADLHVLANIDRSRSIYEALAQVDRHHEMSIEGRIRSQFIYSVLHKTLAQRHQQPIVEWIIRTLRQLHLDHVLNTNEQDDLEQYWLLLEQHSQDGQITDLKLFQEAFHSLYSQRVTPSRLQIMTIHKSKGLEFDCVFLPGLGSKSNTRDAPLLRWLALPTEQDDTLLLVSPIKAAHEETCVLYDYLGKIDAEKNQYEIQRLLYVAVTRAKKRLYLFDNHQNIRQGSFRALLPQHTFLSTTTCAENDTPAITTQELYRLPLNFYHSLPDSSEYLNTHLSFTLNHTPRLIGIVAHALLQWICNHHPESIADIPWQLARHQLISLGFHGQSLDQAINQLQTQLSRMFLDSIGQWIIKAHPEEQNEYELLVEENGTLVTRIIDRTFIINQTRWIIDFKTGQDDESSEQEHQKQVNAYAKLFDTDKTICCGLYYLAHHRWIEWKIEQEFEVID